MTSPTTPLSTLPQPSYATYAQASVTSVNQDGSVSSVSANARWAGDTVSFSAEALDLSSASQNGSLATGSPTSNTAEDNELQTTGDTVSLSGEAATLAAAQDSADLASSLSIASNAGLIASDELDNLAVGDRLASLTTDAGRQLTIDAANFTQLDENGQETAASGYLLTVSDESSSQSYLLTQDILAQEGEGGLLQLSGYTTGDETAGDDIIIGLGGQDLSGGAGNDTIVALADGGDVSITGGSGNDTIAVTGEADTLGLDAGDGDDTVMVQGTFHEASVATGSGNDTVSLNLQAGDNDRVAVDTGSGDDAVTASVIATDNAQVNLQTGSGDDRLVTSTVAAGNSRVQADTGSGDDRVIAAVVAGDNAQADMASGSGDDTVSISLVATANARGSVDTGSGDDRLASVFVTNANAQIQADTGSGDDIVLESVAQTDNSRINLDTGSGDDFVNATWVSTGNSSGSVNLGSGNNAFFGHFSVSRDVEAASDSRTTVATAGLVDSTAGFASYVSVMRDMVSDMSDTSTATQNLTPSTNAAGNTTTNGQTQASGQQANAAGRGLFSNQTAHNAYKLASHGRHGNPAA